MAAEMRRAWDCGARKIWILNVGDLKPAEYHTELFLDMAWNADAVAPEKGRRTPAVLVGTGIRAGRCAGAPRP